MVDHFTEIYSLHTAWLIVMYTIVACAVVTVAMLATMWRLKPRPFSPPRRGTSGRRA